LWDFPERVAATGLANGAGSSESRSQDAGGAAHCLKGELACFGAADTSAVALQLEQTGWAGGTDGGTELLAELKSQMIRLWTSMGGVAAREVMAHTAGSS